MRLARLVPLILAAFAAGAAPANAGEAVIGLAAPLSGPMALLGRQMETGATLAAGDTKLVTADTKCSKEGGLAAAQALLKAGAQIVTGFLCAEALNAALPVLSAANVPVIVAGVRANALTDRRDKTGFLIWRTAPRADAEVTAASQILVDRWRNALFAIIDDGTIYGRELAQGLRLSAEEQGLKAIFTDTYRPQLAQQIALVTRLKKAGATHIFVGGDRDDVAIIARDAAERGIDLEIVGGEALQSAPGDVPLPKGVLAIGLPDTASALPANASAIMQTLGMMAEGYVVPGYTAVEVAKAALDKGVPTDAAGWQTRFDDQSFETASGPLTFDAKGDTMQNPYRLLEWDGAAFREVQ